MKRASIEASRNWSAEVRRFALAQLAQVADQLHPVLLRRDQGRAGEKALELDLELLDAVGHQVELLRRRRTRRYRRRARPVAAGATARAASGGA